MTKTEKIEAFREKYLPVWAILPLISIFVLNCLIYWGSGVLTADRYHFDFTMSLDRAVPLIPQFIWIYILAFPFWAVNYILAAQRGKDGFYRFVATDLTVHITCLIQKCLSAAKLPIQGDTSPEKLRSSLFLSNISPFLRKLLFLSVHLIFTVTLQYTRLYKKRKEGKPLFFNFLL